MVAEPQIYLSAKIPLQLAVPSLLLLTVVVCQLRPDLSFLTETMLLWVEDCIDVYMDIDQF